MMRDFLQSLRDPGTYFERYGNKGFAALVAVVAVVEALQRSIF